MSSYKESPNRLLNLRVSSYEIKKAKLKTNKILSEKHIEDIMDKFNSGYIYEFPTKNNVPLDLSPNYKRMELHNYVEMWTELLNMATPNYYLNKGIILTCSADYIRFRNRPEFIEPHKMIIKSLESILKEVSSIMIESKFKMSNDGYELEVEGYEPIKISQYYGF